MIQIAPGVAVANTPGMTINGLSPDEFNRQNAIWQENIHKRIDTSVFDLDKLVHSLCSETWMRHCRVIPNYMPPYPNEHTRPTVVVQWRNPEDESKTQFLRHSAGPLQGTFWDMYGDDFHSPELAIVMLSRSHPPRGAGRFSFTANPID